ncbi:hypothetical protein DFH07DRAFT_968353 [Mycena maculata]|uniref:Uncharacterized protein n=1 Tax=Mycena maculata TaxID=230809 RepID=A0AAD7MUJ3_9AGAR|nr:hypothetical protein DFH07DRAFT_968353 [Mycena maculata]
MSAIVYQYDLDEHSSLDIGDTSDSRQSARDYLEALYPFPTGRVPRRSPWAPTARTTIITCGAEQPWTTENFYEHHSPLLVLPGIGIDDAAIPERPQKQRKLSGCGAEIHTAAIAMPKGGVWTGNVGGVKACVVLLEKQYVPAETRIHLATPGRDPCGCEYGCVGCAACGNPLGELFTPCAKHAGVDVPTVYSFLASAVSPPLPSESPDRSPVPSPGPIAVVDSPPQQNVDLSAWIPYPLPRTPNPHPPPTTGEHQNPIVMRWRTPPPRDRPHLRPIPSDPSEPAPIVFQQPRAPPRVSRISLAPPPPQTDPASNPNPNPPPIMRPIRPLPTRAPRAPPPLPATRTRTPADVAMLAALRARPTPDAAALRRMEDEDAALFALLAQLNERGSERRSEGRLPAGATTRVLRVGRRGGPGATAGERDAAGS